MISGWYCSQTFFPFSISLNFPVVLLMEKHVCRHTWDANINRDVNIKGGGNIKKDVNIKRDINIKGDVNIRRDVNIKGDGNIKGDVNIRRDFNINGGYPYMYNVYTYIKLLLHFCLSQK